MSEGAERIEQLYRLLLLSCCMQTCCWIFDSSCSAGQLIIADNLNIWLSTPSRSMIIGHANLGMPYAAFLLSLSEHFSLSGSALLYDIKLCNYFSYNLYLESTANLVFKRIVLRFMNISWCTVLEVNYGNNILSACVISLTVLGDIRQFSLSSLVLCEFRTR